MLSAFILSSVWAYLGLTLIGLFSVDDSSWQVSGLLSL